MTSKERPSKRQKTDPSRPGGQPDTLDVSVQVAPAASVSQRYSNSLEFWRRQLAGDLPQLALPYDRPKVPGPFRSSAVERFDLPADLTAKLKQASAEAGCPFYASLLAGLAILLHRYSRLDEITIGAQSEWSGAHEFEGAPRVDASLLALRVDLSGDPSFQKLQGRVHAALMDTAAHGGAAFAEVLQEIRSRPDLESYSPFSVAASQTSGNASAGNLAAGGPFLLDLNFSFRDCGDKLSGTIEYAADLFDASTIENMIGHWRNLLAAACENPGQHISELAILSPAERERILYDWNRTRAEYPNACVHQLFERQAAKTPDLPAVIHENGALTYRELNERANQLARYLRTRGVSPESLVGVCLSRTPEMVIAFLAIWKAGGAYVPLDPTYPRERLAYMMSDSRAALLLTVKGLSHLFPSMDAETVLLDADGERFAGESSANFATGAAPSNLAYVMYTSGSTGKSKGAMILHQGLANYLTWAVRAYGIEEGGSVPVHSSISFDLTVTSLYPALLAGASIELLPEDAGAQSLLEALRRQRRNLVKITPAHLELLAQEIQPAEAASITKIFVIGGENLPAESLRLWREHAPDTRLINEYGPTETVVGCCVHEIGVGDSRTGSVPIGRPIANTELYVLDGRMQPVPVGVPGELYIGGDGVARGYLNQPELTAQKFLPDPFSGRDGSRLYRTGDLARYRRDDTLEFLGRVDTQVKVRGYRIELGEVEAALVECAGVKSCAVLAREDQPGDKHLVAYIVSSDERKIPASELRDSLKEKLPRYMIPTHFVFLDAFPLTKNGKIDRKALPAPGARHTRAEEALSQNDPLQNLLAGASGGDSGAALRRARRRTETEKALIAIWAEVLRVEDPGVQDDFFNLGGHSLPAIKVLSRIRDVFGVEVPAQTIFEHPTIAALGAVISEARSASGGIRNILPRAGSGPCVLSFAQERLWFLNQLAPGSPVYNVADAIAFDGLCGASAMRHALEELVRRHEILRTSFFLGEGRPMQTAAGTVEVAFREIDLGSRDDEERERAWKGVIAEEARKPFDLSQAPLFRAALVHLNEREHKLLFAIHHIIADEWSMEIVHDEIKQLYFAFSRGLPSPLPELPIQYADFAAWQRRELSGGALQAQAAHWRKELAGAPAALELPTDKPRPAVQSFRGATELFRIPAELAEKLKTLSREQHATLFMTLEAAFATLLHRYSGQDDLLVGTPISGRTRSETERLIGLFLNTVTLRARFSERMNFRALLQQTRDCALRAYAHPDMPLEQLVAELGIERDASRSPLFQVMFVLHDGAGVSELSKASGNQELSTGTSKFDLTLVVSETADGLEGLFEYSTDLFEAATIRRMCEHFQTLLRAIADDPDQNISKLPMLTDAERRQQLTEWNDTSTSHPAAKGSLHQMIEEQATRTPDSVAQVFDGREMTYRELDERAGRLANHLRNLGVGPDQLVGLLVDRSLEMLVGLLGILKAGGAYVPLDPAFPPDRLSYMVEDSGMEVLVTHRLLDATLRARPATVVRLDSDWNDIARAEASPLPPAESASQNLAYVLYTSGSTGKPKGVAIPHSAIVNFLLSIRQEPGFTERDTLLAVTTLSFDIAALELYLPLITGGKVAIASAKEARDPALLQERIRDSRCTVMQATPATWRALIHAGWRGSLNLKILCGGEALPRDLADDLLTRCGELWNMYGPTETTVWSTLQRVTAGKGAVSIGKPVANTQVYILDKRMNLVPQGAAGELYIGGDGLARGYLHRDELTRERFISNPYARGTLIYRTGDLARWLPDGTLECLGRADSQVKVRGYRIELGEVEAALSAHPAVKQCVVIAREDAPGIKALAAYFVLQMPGLPPAAGDLRAFLKTSLPEYMIPSAFVPMERLPLTPSGKIDRKALPKPNALGSDATQAVVPARDALDRMLLQVWSNVLGLKCVGLRDNFFDRGGHSLAAVQMMAEIKKVTGQAVPVATLFQAATVEALADLLRREGWKPSWSSLVPIHTQGSRAPLFLVHGAEGNVLLYRQVAQYLDDDQPVYGLQSQGLNGSGELATTFPEMASAYIKEIRTVQPRGPYHLGGYCLGGVIALEIARQLSEAGEQVASVLMLETYNLKSLSLRKFKFEAPIRFLQNIWFHAASFFALPSADRTKFLNGKLQTAAGRIAIRLKALLRWMGSMGSAAAPDDYPHLRIKQANDDANLEYEPKPYDGRVVVIRPKCYFVGQDSEDFGWSGIARGNLQVRELPVYPKAILAEPFCQQLAKMMNAMLRNA